MSMRDRQWDRRWVKTGVDGLWGMKISDLYIAQVFLCLFPSLLSSAYKNLNQNKNPV
jgi:hypothetical protein